VEQLLDVVGCRFQEIVEKSSKVEPLVVMWRDNLVEQSIGIDRIARGDDGEHSSIRFKMPIEGRMSYFWIHMFVSREAFLEVVDGAESELAVEMAPEDQAVGEAFAQVFEGKWVQVSIDHRDHECGKAVTVNSGIVLTEDDLGFAVLEVASCDIEDEEESDPEDIDDSRESPGGNGMAI